MRLRDERERRRREEATDRQTETETKQELNRTGLDSLTQRGKEFRVGSDPALSLVSWVSACPARTRLGPTGCRWLARDGPLAPMQSSPAWCDGTSTPAELLRLFRYSPISLSLCLPHQDAIYNFNYYNNYNYSYIYYYYFYYYYYCY